MNWRPYITGAVSAFVYLTILHFLPKKLKVWMRTIIAIVMTVALTCLIHLIHDYFTEGDL